MTTYKAHWAEKEEYAVPGAARKGSAHINYRVTGLPGDTWLVRAEWLLNVFIHTHPKNKRRVLTWREIGGVKLERRMEARRKAAAKRKAEKMRQAEKKRTKR